MRGREAISCIDEGEKENIGFRFIDILPSTPAGALEQRRRMALLMRQAPGPPEEVSQSITSLLNTGEFRTCSLRSSEFDAAMAGPRKREIELGIFYTSPDSWRT